MNETGQDSNQSLRSIERRGSVATITKPEGKYSIAYGIHILEGKQDIPTGVDGICFEWASRYPEGDDVQKAAVENQKPLFDFAAQNRLPLLAVDCSITSASLAEGLIGPLEFVMGSYLFGRMREGVAKQGMTRRQFLKTMLMGGAALYLALPNTSLFGRFGSSLTGIGEEQTAEISNLLKEHIQNTKF